MPQKINKLKRYLFENSIPQKLLEQEIRSLFGYDNAQSHISNIINGKVDGYTLTTAKRIVCALRSITQDNTITLDTIIDQEEFYEQILK